jgi:hypothetical protein
MTRPDMNLARFRALLEAYGTHFERWPAAERAAGRALLLSEPAARSAFDEQAALDALLDAAPIPALPSALEQQLLAIPRANQQALPFRGRALWMPALGWAAAAMVGLWIGTQYPADDEDVNSVTAAAVDGATSSDEEAFIALAAGPADSMLESP